MNLGETEEVLSTLSALAEGGETMALATIVSVSGSTYRRPGARLLVPATGPSIGNLSGGCLEGEVEELARRVMDEQVPRLAFYDLTADDEVIWGWGLGCNGAIEVFVEPAARAAEVAEALRAAIETERPVAVATVLESTLSEVITGARLVVDAEGIPAKTLGHDGVDALVLPIAADALMRDATAVHEVEVGGARLRVFVEVLAPPLRLIICGAGHDAVPVAEIASGLGWRVTVIDDRAGMLEADRWPRSVRRVRCEPRLAAKTVGLDERSYMVVMSHNFLRDKDYLRGALEETGPYLGMLGPGARTERLVAELEREGVSIPADAGRHMFGPAGLDLGGEGPKEIAAAIVAEVLAVSRGRPAGFLRDRHGSIHPGEEPSPAAREEE